MYYRPDHAVAADVIPFFYDGEYKLFYLLDYRNWEKHGEGVPWNLVTSKNLVDYTELGEVLSRGTANAQDLYVFTGSVFAEGGKFYIFYTGHNYHLADQGKPMQAILMAESTDLVHWTKRDDFIFYAPDTIEKHDFRDPYVYYDAEAAKYKMLLAGRLKTGAYRERGCTLVAESTDLLNWAVNPTPFYAPSAFYTHECPDLFQIGKWYYLLFSEFNDKCCTHYRMSRSINGPWITPLVDTFDNRSFYAAKAASDGQKRILFGWNPIKNNEKDSERWQWGGTIVPHELVQSSDGTLFVKCPETVRHQYTRPYALAMQESTGNVQQSGEVIKIGDHAGNSKITFGKLPNNCKIEAIFSYRGTAKEFGFFFNTTMDYLAGYHVKFEPQFNRLCMDKPKTNWDDRHFVVESERYCVAKPRVRHQVVMILEGSVLEVYVDDLVAMSTRMFDLSNLNFGLFSNSSELIIHQLKVSY